jgi:hypothetical protein
MAAMTAASSDLRFHFADLEIPEEVQAALYHVGFTTMRLFAGIDETRVEVRTAVKDIIGLDHVTSTENRKSVALLLSAWESARTHIEAETKVNAESKTGQTPRLVQVTEVAAMRKAIETRHGILQDSEMPHKSFLAVKLEQVENNDPRVEDLREVLCMEDQDLDLFSGLVESSGTALKIRPAKANIPMPANAEELRERHRRIALAWELIATKHKNRAWLNPQVVDDYRKLSDFVLGKHVAQLEISTGYGVRGPPWSLVLAFENALRKKAYEAIREGSQSTISSALTAIRKDPEIMNLHFLVPLTLQTSSSSQRSTTATSGAGYSQSQSFVEAGRDEGRGRGGKGRGGRGRGGAAKTKKKGKLTLDNGKRICFRFNSAGGCKGGCGFEHICQKCKGGHAKQQCPKKADTDRV